MGSINDDIEIKKHQIAYYHNKIKQANDDWIQRKPDNDDKKNSDYRQKYIQLVHNFWESISELNDKLDELLIKRDNCARFPLNVIGPLISKVISEVEETNFDYVEAYYYEIPSVYDIYEDFEPGIDGYICCITNNSCISQSDLSDDDVYKILKDDNTLCLATIGFKMDPYKYKNHYYYSQQIDSNYDDIAFYSPNYDIPVKKFGYINDLIEMLLQRQIEKDFSLCKDDYEEIADFIISK